MAATVAERLYPRLPIFLQNVACSYQGWRDVHIRFGKFFHHKLQELEKMQWWSAADIDRYQDEQLANLIRYVYDNVPYYRDVMKARGLQPRDIRTRDDLKKLPILTKEDVRANVSRLVSTAAAREQLVNRHTSGTTGKSLEFFTSKDGIAFQWAIWWRHRMRFGLQFGDPHVTFTGKRVVPPAQHVPPYWRYNRPMRQVLINMHHLTPNKIGDVVAHLNDFPARFYSGYPSIIHTAAALASESGLSLHSRPDAVITGAENILDFQRRDIERFTRARVTDQYGFSEGCGNASTCEQQVYHEDFEFGILEAAEEKPGHGQTILCTGFANPEFPFIRYDVGDRATWASAQLQCPCGRQSRILRTIDGRKDDYVITPEGRRIMRFDYIFKETERVQECQVVQSTLGAITLRIVPRPGFSGYDEQRIRENIAQWISPELAVHIETVPEVEREANGKFRAVKSLLSAAHVQRN